jgi:phosphatidylinositol alpha-mannosyltransferase
MMHVGLVCPYDLGRPGGVQSVVLALGRRLHQGGHRVTLVSPGAEPEGWPAGWRRAGRTVRVRANRSVVPLSIDPRCRRLVAGALAGVDVVHVHEPLIPLVGWGALALEPPTVATFHADPARWARLVYCAGAGVLAAGMRRRVLTAVSPVAASAVPAGWGPVEIVPNGVDLASYRSGVERQPARVVFLGRDEPRKGLDVVLAAWPLVRRRVGSAELVIVGARRPRLPAGATALGRVGEADKRSILASAAVVAVPGLGGESFGVVMVEAMAAGAAVVASDLAGFRHVAGDSARWVPPGDEVALADAITTLLVDHAERRRLVATATDRAARFDWGVVVGSYLAAYRRAGEVG